MEELKGYPMNSSTGIAEQLMIRLATKTNFPGPVQVGIMSQSSANLWTNEQLAAGCQHTRLAICPITLSYILEFFSILQYNTILKYDIITQYIAICIVAEMMCCLFN